MKKDSVDLIFDNIFDEKIGKNKMLFENYQSIYNLPISINKCEVSKKLFDYCARKKYFVLLLLYDNDGKVFFSRVMSDILEWGLPGGSIKDDETIKSALNRLTKNINENLLIDCVEPELIIKNTYNYGADIIEHIGLGFIAKIRSLNNVDIKKIPGDFIQVNENEMKYVNRNASKELVRIFLKRYKELTVKLKDNFQDEEVITNEKYKKDMCSTIK